MKSFTEYLNESLGYTDFFGKQVSHEDALLEQLASDIISILQEEQGISEKSFGEMDRICKEAREYVKKDPEILKQANEFYNNKRRISLLAEMLYEKMKSNETIH